MKPKGFTPHISLLPGSPKEFVYPPVGAQQTITCWDMSWRERFWALISGDVWISVCRTGETPLHLSASVTVFKPVDELAAAAAQAKKEKS